MLWRKLEILHFKLKGNFLLPAKNVLAGLLNHSKQREDIDCFTNYLFAATFLQVKEHLNLF